MTHRSDSRTVPSTARQSSTRHLPLAALAMLLLLPTARGAAPVQLTSGPGNDTEARWSPDGKIIAFQSDRNGDLDILLLDLASGKVRPLVTGPDQACFPCWSPDGKTIVYAEGRFTTTAARAVETGSSEGYHLFALPASGGKRQQLTSGRCRDFLATFTPDGKDLVFTSTRGSNETGTGLQMLSLGNAGSAPRTLIDAKGNDVGAMQPAISPNGKLVAYAEVLGSRANWRISIMALEHPNQRLALTPFDKSFYAPRWSPDGRMLACTGYRPGDPGWGIYLIELPSCALLRLDLGPGNARSPAWSPDGRSLVFESNRSGAYKLYRVAVGTPVFPPGPTRKHWRRKKLFELDFSRDPGDRIVNRLDPRQAISRPRDLPWDSAGALRFGHGILSFPQVKNFAFGLAPFYISLTFRVDSRPGKLRIIAVGDYPEHRMGWQFFLTPDNFLYFNARAPSGTFVGAKSNAPLPLGKTIVATGIREMNGTVELYLDGTRQHRIGGGATMNYGIPRQIRLGSQFNGSSRFDGLIFRMKAGTGLPAVKEIRTLDLEEYYSR